MTIIRDLYDGKYSGGKYLAINQEYGRMSPYIEESEDLCKVWWEQHGSDYIIQVSQVEN